MKWIHSLFYDLIVIHRAISGSAVMVGITFFRLLTFNVTLQERYGYHLNFEVRLGPFAASIGLGIYQ